MSEIPARAAGAAPWWQTGVFYQIYPRSFMDASGDGVGDLAGIIERLDYLNDGTDRSLGVDALWISPCFQSPMADFGYDISDYRKIDPLFGDNAEMDRLIGEAHRRGIRVLLDLVPNHTSEQHPWFVESRSSRDNPRHDWYIWHDGLPGRRPPNNWVASFGGSAWQWDERRGQFYLHSFLAEQPDLNWRNPAVKEAMFDIIRYWLARGVDGFRIDAIHYLMKDPQLRDNPSQLHLLPYYRQRHLHDMDRPEVHPLLVELRRMLDSFAGERMAVGETFLWDPAAIARYYGSGQDELHLAFNFRLLFSPWWAPAFRSVIEKMEAVLPQGSWPVWCLSNHDQTRHITRYGRTGRAVGRARLAALLLLALRGTPFLYYGEEIGLRSHRIPRQRLVDPPGKRYWPLYPGRDVARTPMQWNGEPGGGFSTGEPWLPFPSDAGQIHVAAQLDDPASLLSLYRRLIRVRKAHPALQQGSYTPLDGLGVFGMAFVRQHGDERLLVLANMSRISLSFELRRAGLETARVVAGTAWPERAVGSELRDIVRLGPEEGLILRG